MTRDAEPLLLILSSPSGAGKTTLTQRLLQEEGLGLTFSVSLTTRSPRPNEVDGQDYHFVDRQTFGNRRDAGELAEWAEVHGNLYGTSTAEIDRARKAGARALLFDVDYQGARQIKAKLPQAVGVFILPPSMAELRRRLEGRGTETEASVKRRFAQAQVEIEHYPFFDYLVLNEDLQRALAELKGIIHAELCRRPRLAERAEALLDE